MKNGGIIALILFVVWGVILLFLPTAFAPDPAPTQPPVPTVSADPTEPPSFLSQIDQTTWDYYKLIALRNEFGSQSMQGVVKKWTTPISIYIGEHHTQEDLSIIQNHIEDLQAISGIPDMAVTDSFEDANLTISFITQAEMNVKTESHGEIALGYTTVWWDQQGSITKAEIDIVYDVQTQMERKHTLLEEITQAMGLMNDAILYEDSIFYVEYKPDILALSLLDWKLLQIHYTDIIEPGMKEGAVEALYTKAHA